MKKRVSFVQVLKTEVGIALLLCLLVTPIVVATNFTASLTLILLHALVITGSIAVCSTLLVWLIPLPQKFRLVVMIVLRIVAISISTACALPIISTLSGIPVYRLACRPLWAAMIPVVSAYVIVSLIRTLQNEREKTLQAEVAKAQSAWQALAAQIRPHFLFNCLNGLEQLVASAPNRAQANIRALASMYRAVLDASKKKWVPLRQELKLVADYLQLQEMRYGDRLKHRFESAESFRNIPFPATLLLSLVENAVKHGVENMAERGDIVIRFENADMQLVAVVINRVNSRVVADTAPGHGTKDIQQRLSLLYGDAASYEFQIENNFARATVRIPLETSE